jgi:hypothetical protein
VSHAPLAAEAFTGGLLCQLEPSMSVVVRGHKIWAGALLVASDRRSRRRWLRLLDMAVACSVAGRQEGTAANVDGALDVLHVQLPDAVLVELTLSIIERSRTAASPSSDARLRETAGPHANRPTRWARHQGGRTGWS